MNISFYLLLFCFGILCLGIICFKAFCGYDREAAEGAAFMSGLAIVAIIAIVAFECIATNVSTMSIFGNESVSSGKPFATVVRNVRPNGKPVMLVICQKRYFMTTATKNETVMPGQIKTFNRAVVIDEYEMDDNLDM